MKKNLPIACPGCSHALKVKMLHCEKCGTEVNGMFDLTVLCSLASDDQDFILEFVKFSGSLKEMAGHMKLSYPTVRNRLDDLIAKIREAEKVYATK